MARIKSINSVIVPFRAPEITKRISLFPQELIDFHDRNMKIEDRFQIIDKFLDTFPSWIGLDLKRFRAYPTSGSTEAIASSLREALRTGKTIALVENEYRYYQHVCSTLSINYKTIRDPKELTYNDIFVTSIPFCKTGLVSNIQFAALDKCENEGIECWIDCAYLGTGEDISFSIPKSTTNIFFTFSKNMGLSLQRIGIWYSSWVMPDRDVVLDCGYTNIGNIALVTDLMQTFPRGWLFKNYRSVQLSCTSTPINIVYMDSNGCITNKMYDFIEKRK